MVGAGFVLELSSRKGNMLAVADVSLHMWFGEFALVWLLSSLTPSDVLSGFFACLCMCLLLMQQQNQPKFVIVLHCAL